MTPQQVREQILIAVEALVAFKATPEGAVTYTLTADEANVALLNLEIAARIVNLCDKPDLIGVGSYRADDSLGDALKDTAASMDRLVEFIKKVHAAGGQRCLTDLRISLAKAETALAPEEHIELFKREIASLEAEIAG